jgi:LEA14-like dessication related protein
MFLLLNACSSFKEVEFKGVENVSFGKQEDSQIPLIFDVRINNPNQFNILLKKGVVDVFLNNQFLGKSTLSNKITIEKNKETVYPIVINTSFSNLSKAALSSLGALLGKKLILKIDGKIIVKALIIRKKIDINFTEEISPSTLLNF